MSNTKLNIPKKLKIGFNNRNDTYTGKLAYVIYYDEKGVLRKEKSWESWRDKKIDPLEIDNEPTSGFVLNQKVGGYAYSWHARQTAVRVFDPRGFEFEISVENLLFILQECSAIKGKGIEGEFVYAWEDTNLVLLPVECQEYQESVKFTKLKTVKIDRKSMIPGHVYLTKSMEKMLYLGKENYWEPSHSYPANNLTSTNFGKKHIFINLKHINDGVEQYLAQSGFDKIAEKLSDEVFSDFIHQHTIFKNGLYGSPIKEITFEETPYTPTSKFGHIKPTTYRYSFVKVRDAYLCTNELWHKGGTIYVWRSGWSAELLSSENGTIISDRHQLPLIEFDFSKEKLYKLVITLESGTKYQLSDYSRFIRN